MQYKTRILLSHLMTLILVLGCISVPNIAKADEYEYSKENATIWKTYSGSVDGVERTLVAVILEDGTTTSQYIKIGDQESGLLWFNNLDVGIDQYGAVWIIDGDHEILWWSYDLEQNFDTPFTSVGFWGIPKPGTELEDWERIDDVESFDTEGSGEQTIITGYRTFSGEICSLPTFNEMKDMTGKEYSVPEPLYIPKGMEGLITPRPTTPTPVPPTPTPEASEPSTPTQTPDAPVSGTPSLTPDMPVTVTPAPVSDTPTPKVGSKKVSIKTEKKAKVLYEGDEFIGQYALKKGVLIWKGPKKKGKMKGVKQVGFNKKTKKLVILTKKGDGYVLSFKNGKKKRVVKKKGKKFIYSGKFVTKIKTTSGKVNVSNK